MAVPVCAAAREVEAARKSQDSAHVSASFVSLSSSASMSFSTCCCGVHFTEKSISPNNPDDLMKFQSHVHQIRWDFHGSAAALAVSSWAHELSLNFSSRSPFYGYFNLRLVQSTKSPRLISPDPVNHSHARRVSSTVEDWHYQKAHKDLARW